MKKLRKIVLIIMIMILLISSSKVFADEITDHIGAVEFTEEFKEWQNLSDEEREEVVEPRAYEVTYTKYDITNPINVADSVGASYLSEFDLRKYISSNVSIKDQQQTNSCWCFASLGMLESTLALKDYHNNSVGRVYDFSERHMEYSTTRKFLNNQVNQYGFNRNIGDGGNYLVSLPYMISGFGPVDELDMPFENNENQIDISAIQNKNVTAQVKDYIIFPSYGLNDDKTEIIQTMKEHIQKYGGIEASFSAEALNSDYYNNNTGAYYNNSSKAKADHDVLIIGWDDNYSVNNFSEKHKPSQNGAWIIKNSYGRELEYTFDDFKEAFFNTYRDKCIEKGYNTPSQIPDSLVEASCDDAGVRYENRVMYMPLGDYGYMYVSYEDAIIYDVMEGVEKAENSTDYNHIYQYDYNGQSASIPLNGLNTVYIAEVFDRVTRDEEFVKEIAVRTSETVRCEVYMMTDGNDANLNRYVRVDLVDGSSKAVGPGYHTLEFLNPMALNGTTFTVVVKMTSLRDDGIDVPIEMPFEKSIYENVEVEEQKCFISYEGLIEDSTWIDCGDLNEVTNGGVYDSDTCIKVFTTKQTEETKLEGIEIVTPPSKTVYTEGEDFNKTGMKVIARYSDGTTKEITDYTVINGTDLTTDQTYVTISYQGKTTSQSITVNAKQSDVKTEKAILADFTNSAASINTLSVYYFSDSSKQDYKLIGMNIKDVYRVNTNDSDTYYYYLSSNSKATNITDWVEITEQQRNVKELSFEINTSKLANYDEVLKSDNLYLYIKEVAKKGSDTKEQVTRALPLTSGNDPVVYKDNVKQSGTKTNSNASQSTNNGGNNSSSSSSSSSGTSSSSSRTSNSSSTTTRATNTNNRNTSSYVNNVVDDTTANKRIPDTGKASILLVILVMSVSGLYIYKKYSNIKY